MERKNLLIIFYRNPVFGRVKTRLAATVGDEKTLMIYRRLADHTKSVCEKLAVTKAVFYSEYVDAEDLWDSNLFEKHVQRGESLGEKMRNAFSDGFSHGYQSICIIGTDCAQLLAQDLEIAFAGLENFDAVIGPAVDGGYYLLGLNKMMASVFENKNWSTSTVARDTIEDFRKADINYFVLRELTDVDVEGDLPPEWR